VSHEQYVARRVDGAWCVVDRVTEQPVSQHGAGAAGATAARAAADTLNTRAVKAGTRAAELREWRRAHNLSQPALASLLGVTVVSLSRWENGARSIPTLLERALRDVERELDARFQARAS